jgi:putative IMPACT (imprinted ancient) family translation regulator
MNFDDAHKEITQQYPKATHYCWAYRFTGAQILEHSSDAGEPAGSAGRPILGALKKFSLLNVMAVVTRYYGGVKLGVPGLISAYGEATTKALQSAQICVLEPMSRIHFHSSYEIYNIFLEILKKYNVASSNMSACFEEIISGAFDIPLYDVESLAVELNELSHRAGTFEYSIVNLDE